MANIAHPSPEPALPSGMDPCFHPPVNNGNPAANTPIFAEWIREANPGDAVMATGDQLSRYTGNDEGKDTRFVVFGQNASTSAVLDAPIQRLDGTKTAFVLDPALPTKTMYLVWPQNHEGYGRPIAINQTEAWWVGPKTAKAGQTISLYGRNLSHEGGTTAAWIYIKPAGSAGQWCSVVSVNPYRVTFVVPSGLANGTYEVWAHNGHGAHYGWSGPVSLTVNSGITWTSTVYNVKTDFGAAGDGTTDDTSAVTAAFTAAAASPYSTVYFPTGTYSVTGTLTPPSNVRLLGDGKAVSTIIGAQSQTSTLVSFASGRTNIEVRDLALDTGTYPVTGVTPWTRVLLGFSGATNLRFENVALLAKGYKGGTGGTVSDWLALTPSTAMNTNLAFVSCDLTGQLFNLIGTQVFFEQCHMYAMNDGNMVELSGSSDVSVTDCTWQDFDNSVDKAPPNGWGLGRFMIVRNPSKQYSWNHYYGGNTVTNSGIRLSASFANYGEIFLFEYNQANFDGSPVSTTATTATFSSVTDKVVPGLAAVIIRGKGLGQIRRVTSVNATTGQITVSPAWNVIPDTTSRIALQSALAHAVIHGNAIDGKKANVDSTKSTAQAGAMLQGCLDITVAGNTINECRMGLNPYSYGQNPTYAPVPGFFQLYRDNTINYTLSAFQDRFNGTGATVAQDDTLYTLAHDFRHNTVTNTLTRSLEVYFNTTTASDVYYTSPTMEMVTMQHNEITDTKRGYGRTGTPSKIGSVLLLNNDIDAGSMAGSAVYAAFTPLSGKPAQGGNVYTNFSTVYSNYPGSPVYAPVLELPYRRLTLEGTSGGSTETGTLLIWNSGTDTLPWTAVSDSAWLSVSSTSGSVLDQNSSASVTLTANPASLSPGTYTGTVTVTSTTTSGTQVKKMTVEFIVTP
ncbi:MAG TPA: glycosyl hydrolase family 28-related protein [Opitutaceae bacterium]|nr:glycosyl hydrolase family 28-related protein [Opitutaceae bacterium]